jgi:23S rRNA pseudouridine1911/1915/1917 synthase
MDEIPLEILFEDPWLIVLNKAAGSIVHPVGRHVNDTIVSALHVRFHAQPTKQGVPPMIVHRLDRDTSGVLVLAKDEDVRKTLGLAFESRDVRKTYLAVVEGDIEETEFSVDKPIGPDPAGDSKILRACTDEGKAAVTHFERLEHHPKHTLLRCRPQTGRQHQIRVHLQFKGHPILCDRLYGKAEPVSAGDLSPNHPAPDVTVLDRQALHSESLSITHPVTGQSLLLYAPSPADLMRLLDHVPAIPVHAD